MTYTEAEVILREYLETEYTRLDAPWDDFFTTAYQAIQDCLEMGLTNSDNDDPA